jgi:betaine-aldehyde dehydrogenase
MGRPLVPAMATATQTRRTSSTATGSTPAEGRTDPVYNPATGEEIAQAPSSTTEDVDRAVKAARNAFENGWGTTTPAERATAILNIADAIEQHADEITELEAANAGKPFEVFKNDEIPAMVDNLRFFAGAARAAEHAQAR